MQPQVTEHVPLHSKLLCKNKADLFRLRPPPPLQVRYAPPPPPPVTEHVPLHTKSLCKNIAHLSGGGNNMRPLSLGAQTEKLQYVTCLGGGGGGVQKICNHLELCYAYTPTYRLSKLLLLASE